MLNFLRFTTSLLLGAFVAFGLLLIDKNFNLLNGGSIKILLLFIITIVLAVFAQLFMKKFLTFDDDKLPSIFYGVFFFTLFFIFLLFIFL